MSKLIKKDFSTIVEANPWRQLRQFTQARIALGRSGNSLPTDALLDFGLAHAQARDAVHAPLNMESVRQQIASTGIETIEVSSAATDRQCYLRRPDLGRRLNAHSRALISSLTISPAPELIFIVADGLSAIAPQRHAAALLHAMQSQLTDWHIGPIILAQQARVALGDEIGELLNAQWVVMLIGERPGLSSPDSLGIYLTYLPRIGRTDADRNCISNVRPEGLSYAGAAHKLNYLLNASRRLKVSGVALKDDSDLQLAGPALPVSL